MNSITKRRTWERKEIFLDMYFSSITSYSINGRNCTIVYTTGPETKMPGAPRHF